MISPVAIAFRQSACAGCATPCALRDDVAAHADPCAACPLQPPAWGPWDCRSEPQVSGLSPQVFSSPLGDRVQRYAQPVALAIDKATRGATHVAQCGGCKSAKGDLNHGRRSDEPGRPVI